MVHDIITDSEKPFKCKEYAMAVTVTLECQVKPEKVEDFKKMMNDALKDTRAFDGCQLVEFYQNQAKPGSMLLYELWDSKEHQQKYLAWRTEQGMLDALAEYLSHEVVISFYDKVT